MSSRDTEINLHELIMKLSYPLEVRERAMRIVSELSDFELPTPEVIGRDDYLMLFVDTGKINFSFSVNDNRVSYNMTDGDISIRGHQSLAASVIPAVAPLRAWKDEGKL